MNVSWSSALILASALSLTACGSNPVNTDALKGEKITQIQLAGGEELESHVNDSSAVSNQYGMLGAVFGAVYDNHVNARREKSLEVIRKPLGNYNIQAQMANKLRQLRGPAFGRVSVETVMQVNDLPANVLGMKTKVYLTSNHNRVVCDTAIKLVNKDKQAYISQFSSAVPIDFSSAKNDDATQHLLDNPAALKAAVNKALDETVKKIAAQLNK